MMDLIEETHHQPKKDTFQLELEAKMEERRAHGFGSGFSPRDSNNSSYSKEEGNLAHVGMNKHKAYSVIDSKQKSFNLNDTLRFDNTKSIFDKPTNLMNKTFDTDLSTKSNLYRSPLRSNDLSGRNSKIKHSFRRDSNVDDALNSSTDSSQMKKELQYSSSSVLHMLPEHSLSRKCKELTSSEDQSLLSESLQSCSETDLPKHRFLKNTKNIQEIRCGKGENVATTSPIPTPRAHKTDFISSHANKNYNPRKSLSDIFGENGFSKGSLLETNDQKSKYNSLRKFEDINEGNINSSLLQEEPDTPKAKDLVSVRQEETIEADTEDKQSMKNFSSYDDDDDILSDLIKRKSSKEEVIVKKITESIENEKMTTEYHEELCFDSKNHVNYSNSEERSEISKSPIALLDGCSVNSDKPKVKPRKQKQQSVIALSQNNQQEEFTQLSDGFNENTERKQSISDELLPQSLQNQHSISKVETKPKAKQKETRISWEVPPDELDIYLLREETFQKWRLVKDKKIKEIQKQKEKEQEKKIKEQQERLNVATITFKAWKQQKDPLIKKKWKIEKNKEEEKKKKEEEERVNKIQGSKVSFEVWKKNKDKMLNEKQKSKQKKELLKTEKLNEEKLEKVKMNTAAFTTWKKTKENILHEEKLNQKQIMNMTIKEKESIISQKEMLSYESYKQWLIRKEENEKEEMSRKQQQNLNYFEPKLAWRPPSQTIKQTQ